MAIKVIHNQSRTKQVKQYEPHSFSYSIEMEVEEGTTQATMEKLQKVVSAQLEKDIKTLDQGLA